MRTSNSKYFCPRCLTSGKGTGWTCGKDHRQDYISSTKIRFPKKNASKARLKEFVNFLKSFWIYEHGTGKYADEFRRKVSLINL